MIIDGRALAAEVLARAKARASLLPHPPRVVAYVSAQAPAATLSYLSIKKKSAEVAGCAFEEVGDESSFATADAVIVQLPVSQEERYLLERIPLEKDADVLSSAARARFESGAHDALLPPVVGAVKEILEYGKVEVKGKKAVVVGNGFLVGEPAAVWLEQQGADVTVLTIESSEEEKTAALSAANIIVSGAGSPHLITPDLLKDGVVLIDAGTSELGGKLAGDADPSCAPKCALFTPVPGGVGPLAVAKLFENTITLAERNKA